VKVAKQLANHIDNGIIAAGGRLPSERELAEKFEVSRPTIREAMIALEIAGRVEIRSGSGIFVSSGNGVSKLPNDAPGPLELLEARFYFESEAAALAAERATTTEIKALEKTIRAMTTENQRCELHEKADERFHTLIAKASGNSAIYSTISNFWELRRMSEMSVFFHEKLRNLGVKPQIRDHQSVLEAIRARDAGAARQAMRDHLQNVIDTVVAEDNEPA
jgi:GntR family transcriptional repressor for pyruvate dehydrogenase complex